MDTYGQELAFPMAQVAMRAGHDPAIGRHDPTVEASNSICAGGEIGSTRAGGGRRSAPPATQRAAWHRRCAHDRAITVHATSTTAGRRECSCHQIAVVGFARGVVDVGGTGRAESRAARHR